MSVALNRATSLDSRPQMAVKPRRHLLGRSSLRSRPQHFSHQAIGVLGLEICPMSGCRRPEPRDLRLQHHYFCWQCVSRLATA